MSPTQHSRFFDGKRLITMTLNFHTAATSKSSLAIARLLSCSTRGSGEGEKHAACLT